MQLPQVNGFRTLRGLGVSGEAEGHALLLGNQALLNEQQVGTKAIEAEITAQASQGATPVLLAVDGKAVALLAVRDPLRSDSVAALQRLHKAGYRLVMLTGDNPTTANAIAKEAGIDEVIAGVLPDGKAEAIKHRKVKDVRWQWWATALTTRQRWLRRMSALRWVAAVMLPLKPRRLP